MRQPETADLPTLDVDAVERALDDEPVLAGVLFGSHARNEASNRSDVDIAVVLPESLTSVERTRIRLGLIERLSDVLGSDHVDVVPLDGDTPPSLVEDVVSDGVLVSGSAEAVTQFRRREAADRSGTDNQAAFDDVLADLERVV